MGTHFEETLENDLERIRERISRMAALGAQALRNALRALENRNRQLAYVVILGDRRVDEMEREVDQLCLGFLLRQQPVAGPLRFAYSTIRINLELERIGDYAESIARQVLKVIPLNLDIPFARFSEIAGLSIPMLHQAVHAFVTQDAALATRTMRVEEEVDQLRNAINEELFELRQKDRIPLEALTPLVTIARRFERVSDQAKNICQETIYCATGEYMRHKGEELFRILFVDTHDACRGPMAAAIGNGLQRSDLFCESAGLNPSPVDSPTVLFLSRKGIDLRNHQPRALKDLPDLERYHVIVGLSKDIQKQLPPPPRKTVFLDWSVPDLAEATGTEKEIQAGYETAYREIQGHIIDLAEAILGEKTK
jgi:phosphate transport system protein